LFNSSLLNDKNKYLSLINFIFSLYSLDSMLKGVLLLSISSVIAAGENIIFSEEYTYSNFLIISKRIFFKKNFTS